MVPRTIELDLPLENAPPPAVDRVAGAERHDHLTAIPGVDDCVAARLLHSFPSLAAVYAADLERLTAVVGAATAARIRWFLDAPLSNAALPGRRPRSGWRHRAA